MKDETKKRIRILGWILFAIYIILLAYALFLSEAYGRKDFATRDYRYNLIPFREIKRFWIYREKLGMISFLNLAGNVIGFIPFGFIMPILGKKRLKAVIVITSGFLCSLWVECMQLILKVGSFDVDDILLNTLGVVAGYIIFFVSNKIRRLLYEPKKKI